MKPADLIFLALVVILPIVVTVRLFQVEPHGRPFLFTYVLAVIGSSLLFGAVAALFMAAGISGLGPFDGLLEAVAAVPVAFFIGVLVRRHRRFKIMGSHAQNH